VAVIDCLKDPDETLKLLLLLLLLLQGEPQVCSGASGGSDRLHERPR
jgi:hypothetical protein